MMHLTRTGCSDDFLFWFCNLPDRQISWYLCVLGGARFSITVHPMFNARLAQKASSSNPLTSLHESAG